MDIAVVTGASGGIGAAVAKMIHEKSGGRLTVCLHFNGNEAAAKAVSAEIPGSFVVKADLSTEAGRKALLDAVLAYVGSPADRSFKATKGGEEVLVKASESGPYSAFVWKTVADPFAGRITMLKAIMLIQVFPNLLALVAVYVIVFQIGEIVPALGLNTHAGLIMVYLGGAMGMNIWLMKGFLDTIPRAIDESGMVDGATHFQIFWNLLLPLLRPILVVIGILSFIGTYGDFLLARVLLNDVDQYTLMVGLQVFTSGQFDKKWGVFSAGALLGALPIMITYLLLQDQIAGGLTQGAVKE